MKIVFFVCEDKSLGVGYLSSYLRQHGHQIYLLFDSRQFAKSYIQNKGLAEYFSKINYFLKRLGEIKPDLIGFSVVTAHYQWALDLSRRIKKNFKIPIIFGGVHPTLLPERVIREDAVDMVCIGEGEEALLELADNFGKRTDIRNIYFKNKGKIIRNLLRPLEQNLDKYPFPDEELFYQILPASYRITSSVITSRGCPYRCTYCSNHSLANIYKGQRYVRRRSVENLLAELQERKYKYKTEHFVFMDDIFASEINWLSEFIPSYKREINLPFNCLAHPNLASERIIGLLKDGGCITIDFGLQSGSEGLRREVLQRAETNQAMIRTAEACKKYGIHFAVDQILDIPTESENDILSSASLLNTVRPDIVNCYNLLYFPKAEIINKAKELGLLGEDKIEQIEEGKLDNLYSTVTFSSGHKEKASSYRRYALFLSSVPLLPRKIVNMVINYPWLRNLFSKLPLSFLPFVKIVVDIKSGLGFIPFSVLRNELFYLRQHIKYLNYVRKK